MYLLIFIYELLCDLIGASLTDHMFSDAMRQCEKEAAAKYFHPREFF